MAPHPTTSRGADEFVTVPDAAAANACADEKLLFGRYRVERELGRGGMGAVIMAQDTLLDVAVALKMIPDEMVRDEEGIRDLKKEVLRGMNLTHPNIVRVYSFEQDATGAAIVMELVDGWTLAQKKAQQPSLCFECGEVLPWLTQLCAALDYAHHEARIAHRDLKPGNLMLTSTGRLKVADFGIASSLSETNSRVSVRNNSAGTPPYMSPQQVMGDRPTHLDDIYSLGATIYELLTGKPPFFRGNILAQVLHEAPVAMAARRLELGVSGEPIPLAWEKVVAACLAKEPSARPQRASDLLAMLANPERALVMSPPVDSRDLKLEVLPEPVSVQRIHPRPVPSHQPAPVEAQIISVKPRRPFSLRPFFAALAALVHGTAEIIGAVLRPILKFAIIVGVICGLLFLKHKWDQKAAARQAEAAKRSQEQQRLSPPASEPRPAPPAASAPPAQAEPRHPGPLNPPPPGGPGGPGPRGRRPPPPPRH